MRLLSFVLVGLFIVNLSATSLIASDVSNLIAGNNTAEVSANNDESSFKLTEPLIISGGDFDLTAATITNEDDLLGKVFGNKFSKKDKLMEFEVFLDGERVGDATLLIGVSKKILVKSLKSVLGDYLLPAEIEKIEKASDKSGFISFEDLEFLKLTTNFDMFTLRLEIDVPIEMKKTRKLVVGSCESYQEKPNVDSATLSGYIYARLSHQQSKSEGEKTNSQTVIINPAVNLLGLLVEGEFSYKKSSSKLDSNNKIRREYTTLVYDMPEHDMRFRVGDIFSNYTNYQSIPRVLGFGFSKAGKAVSLDTFNSNMQVTILRKSTIEIYVNNTLVRTTKDVAPGTYVLDDIPYTYGSNNVYVRIIDDTGREQTVSSNALMDSSFLAHGEFDYGATIGYPEADYYSDGEKKDRYDRKNLTKAAFIKCGLFNTIEASLGIMQNSVGESTGIEIRNNSLAGLVELKCASSRYCGTDELKIKGKFFDAAYTSPSLKIFDKNVRFGMSMNSSDSFFHSYMKPESLRLASDRSENDIDQDENNNCSKSTNIRYQTSIDDLFGACWHMGYSLSNHSGSSRKKTLSINSVKSFPLNGDMFSNCNLNCSFRQSRVNSEPWNRSLNLNLSLTLKDSTTISGNYLKGKTNNSSFSIFRRPQDNGFGYRANIDNQPTSSRYSLNTNYNHHRFKANFAHSYSKSSESTSQNTRLGFETGIFFADNAFAVGSAMPYDGGFVIVNPHNSLKGNNIRFMGNTAESGILGGALLYTSRNYITSSPLDLRDLPDNLELKHDTVIAKGFYKRGAVTEIAAEGSYVARGILKDDDGDLMNLVSGYVIHKTNKDANPAQFFTNSSGNFAISGLKSGKYDVFVNVESCEDFEIDIPESGKNVLDLGDVICKSSNKKDVLNDVLNEGMNDEMEMEMNAGDRVMKAMEREIAAMEDSNEAGEENEKHFVD